MRLEQAPLRVLDPDALAASPLGAALAAARTVGQLLARAGRGRRARAAALTELLRLDREGAVRVALGPDGGALGEARHLLERLDALATADPALHNAIGYERAWPTWEDWFDFVGEDSDIARLKRFERDLYLGWIDPFLDELTAGAEVLDAACGVGRFATVLATRGHRLTLVDGSARALKRALAHVLEAAPRAPLPRAHAADLRDLACLRGARFDAALAIEAVCYQPDPTAALAEIARHVRPGGLVIASVEGRHGALLYDEGVSLAHAPGVLAGAPLSLPGDRFVVHDTEASFRARFDALGLDLLLLEGCHYLPEGPLARLVDWGALDDPAHAADVLRLEQACGRDPTLRPLARAWLAVARVPA